MTYPAVEACRLAHCTYRQIDYWLRYGALGPHHSGPSMGSGARRSLSRREVELVAVCARLSWASKGGVGIESLRPIIELVQPHEAMTGWLVANVGQRWARLVDTPEELGQFMAGIFVALNTCRFEVLELEASVR